MPTATSRPNVTAPPAPSPEEQAEAEIIATFGTIITKLDRHFANASDVAPEDLVKDSPTENWPIKEQADLEVDNWISRWTQYGIEVVGKTEVVSHEVTKVQLDKHLAKSVACRDMRDVSFVNYEGEPTEPPFVPNKFQTWNMTWQHWPDQPEHEWLLIKFELTLDEPC